MKQCFVNIFLLVLQIFYLMFFNADFVTVMYYQKE